MKFPEDKKERIKILALIGIGAVILLVILYYGFSQIASKKKATVAKSDELKENLRKANQEIDQMSKDRKANTETLRKIADLSDKYMLKPILGNYSLSAQDAIERHAQSVGVATDEALLQIRELGIGEIIAPTAEKSPAVKGYTVHVSLFCGYSDLTLFIKEIEASNPLLCVLNVSVLRRPPPEIEAHAVNFDVQWPVWTDPEMPSKLEAQLAASDGTREKKGANEKKK